MRQMSWFTNPTEHWLRFGSVKKLTLFSLALAFPINHALPNIAPRAYAPSKNLESAADYPHNAAGWGDTSAESSNLEVPNSGQGSTDNNQQVQDYGPDSVLYNPPRIDYGARPVPTSKATLQYDSEDYPNDGLEDYSSPSSQPDDQQNEDRGPEPTSSQPSKTNFGPENHPDPAPSPNDRLTK